MAHSSADTSTTRGERPLADLWLTLALRAGAKRARFADSKAPIRELLAGSSSRRFSPEKRPCHLHGSPAYSRSAFPRPYRPVVRTLPFHGSNTGSNPVRVAFDVS